MSNTDSSAIVRLIQIAQQEPILDTIRPAIDTVPTELIGMDELEEPRRSSLGRYLLTGALVVGLGVGAAFYLVDKGSSATTVARGGLPALDQNQHRASAVALPPSPEPTPKVEPLTPAAVEAVATPEVESSAEPAVVEPIAPVVEEAPAAEAGDSPAAEPVVAATPEPVEKAKKSSHKAKKKSRARRSKKKTATKTAAASGASGTLMVGAKPPCRIFIDGRDTGLMTPQRSITLSEGKHKLELKNSEHGIKSRASVVIKAGKSTRVIKDLSDQI